MELARAVKDYVLAHHQDVLAVVIEGSTAKGEDREHSDLEMNVITRSASDTKYYQFIFEGIVVEVAFGAVEDSLRNARTVTKHWPIAADGWTGSVPLFDPDGILPRLAALTANPDPVQADEAMRGVLVSMYEDVCKIRNLMVSGEVRLARYVSLFVGEQAARFLGLLNRQHFNGTRNLLTKPRDFERLPPHFWEDYPALLAVEGTADDLARRAERMYAECDGLWVAAGHARPPAKAFDEAMAQGRVAGPA